LTVCEGQPGQQGRPGHPACVLGVLAVLAVFSLSCTPPPRHGGPILLITFEALRADALGPLGGPPGLMPHLEELARQADWLGRGIAPSSGSVPALGTLLTGLRPWLHQAIHEGRPGLAPELTTLAEALHERGYTTAGYPADPWALDAFGYAQGFDAFGKLGRGRRALDRLANLGAGRHFVWVHLAEPGAPYVRHDEYLPRLGPEAPNLPRRMQGAQLEPFFDPATPLPPGLRRRILAMYRLNAATGDERLGELLRALRASGQWDRTLIVVTSIHGEEIGEHGQVLHGGNLGRAGLEVPLVIKLPQGSPLHLQPRARQRVATARIWATLVEAAGGEPLPATAPSLFRDAPGAVLSELYLTNGTNRFSLVESAADGDLQLLQESRFAPPEPEYFRARVAAVRPLPPLRAPAEPPAALFARLAGAFDRVPPFTGDGGPGALRFQLERWLPAGGTARVDDPAKSAELARRLAVEWHRFVPDEEPPGSQGSGGKDTRKRRGPARKGGARTAPREPGRGPARSR
jgi:Sulfatase